MAAILFVLSAISCCVNNVDTCAVVSDKTWDVVSAANEAVFSAVI